MRPGQGFALRVAPFLEAAPARRDIAGAPAAVPRLPVEAGWRGDALDAPPGASLQMLIQRQAARTPQARAASCGADALSYAELNLRANRLCHRLRRLGAGPGALVAIRLAPSLDMLVAALAVLKTGAAYVPLDAEGPPARAAAVLDEAGAAWLIDRDSDAPLRPLDDPRRIVLERDAAAIAGEPGSDPPPAAEDLACLLPVPGPAARPLLVRVRQRGLVNLACAVRSHLPVWRGEVFLSLAPLDSEMSLLDLFVPLCSGATVAIVDPETSRNPRRLLAALQGCGATVAHAPAATWQVLLDAGMAPQPALSALVPLESLTAELAEALRARLGAVWTYHGAAETTLVATLARYLGGTPQVGEPIANLQLYLLDDAQRAVQPGAEGELHVGGAGLAAGYHGDAGAGRAAWFDVTDASGKPLRLFRTGERARRDAEGRIERRGRCDRRLTIRGHRVEPAEIEVLLRGHPAVEDALVVAHGGGMHALAAYYSLEADAALTPAQAPEALRAWLAARLPAPLRPSVLVPLPAMPADAEALRPWAEAAAERARALPRDPLERCVAELWQELLERRDIGIRDDFFQLGGHSLLAVALVSAAARRFGVDLPSDAPWNEGSTIEGMARQIRRYDEHVGRAPFALLQSGGSAPPLYVVRAPQESLQLGRALAAALRGERPVVAVRPRRDTGAARGDIAAAAEDCAASILAEADHGPYLLAGAGVGGLIACELATRLAAAGREVAFLGLIGSRAPGAELPRRGAAARIAAWLRRGPPSPATTSMRRGAAPSLPALPALPALAAKGRDAPADDRACPLAPCPVPIDLFLPPGTEALIPAWRARAAAGLRCHAWPARDTLDAALAALAAALRASLPLERPGTGRQALAHRGASDPDEIIPG